jgi:hypothetical protein
MVNEERTSNLPAALRGVSSAGEVVVFHPDTGHALALSEASTPELADWKRGVREWIDRARNAVSLVDSEIVARMDRDASWTVKTPVGTLKSVSPAPEVSYKEPVRLRIQLLGMADLGLVTVDAVDEALPESVLVKPNARKLAALAKLPGEVGDAVRKAQVKAERDHRSVGLS